MPTQETQPFNPRQDIKSADLHRVERLVRRNWFNVLTARDILVCFPEKEDFLSIPQQAVNEVIRNIEEWASVIDSGRDTARILENAAALKQLRPDLDPRVFDGVQFLRRPLLEFVQQDLIEQEERAQGDRVRKIPIPYPRWHYDGVRGVTEFANFQIITQGTLLALELSLADREEGKELFLHYAETMNPGFRTRQEYVADALEVGAGLRVLFPEIQLAVKPDFWREVRILLLATRNADLAQFKGSGVEEKLENNLLLYMQQARQATILAG